MFIQLDSDAIPIPLSHAPAAATDAVVTLAADLRQYWVVYWIGWSFDGTPATGAEIQIIYGGSIKHRFPVTQAGPGELNPYLISNVSFLAGNLFGHVVNEEVSVKLTSGGGVVSGRLSVIFK